MKNFAENSKRFICTILILSFMMPSAKVLAVEDTSTASDLWVSDTGSFAEIFEESSSNLDFDELNVLPNSVRYSYTMTSVDAEESPLCDFSFYNSVAT